MPNFEQVFEQHYARVYRFVRAMCQDSTQAEELTQQTFFNALQHIGNFRGECRMEVWLCQIAKHAFYADQKRRQRNGGAPEDFEQPGPLLEVEVQRREDVQRLHRILHTLDEPYREVFTLRIFGELSFRDVAQLFGKTESWARVTYYRAKLKIQEAMTREEIEEEER